MEQYIPKYALVAEIKRRKELVSDPIFNTNDLLIGERNAYFNLLLFLDTLEVKGVDLDKEIDLAEDKYHGFESLSRADIIEIIKHFFELGMSVSNKA